MFIHTAVSRSCGKCPWKTAGSASCFHRAWMDTLHLILAWPLPHYSCIHALYTYYARNRYGSIVRGWMDGSNHPSIHLSIHTHPSIPSILGMMEAQSLPSHMHPNCVYTCMSCVEMVFKGITLILSKEAKRRHFSLFSGDIASVLVQVSSNFSYHAVHACMQNAHNKWYCIYTHTHCDHYSMFMHTA